MTDKVCGVDVGKDELVFALTSSTKPKKVSNRGADIERLVRKAREQGVTLVVVEATGGYERALVASLWKAKIKVAVINPRQSRAFAKSIGLEAKTDPVDSRLLARMGESVELRCTPEPSAEVLQMRALLTRRAQLVGIIAMERCHLKAPLMLESEKLSLRAHLLSLKNMVKKIDEQILAIIGASHEKQPVLELLTSVKGIGKVAAFQLIANLPELGRINRRKIAALVGLAPYNRDSGHSSGQRHIYGGRAEVRTALYMATVTAVRCNPKLKPYFINLKKRGKHSLIALVAAMRKLLLILNAMMREHILSAAQPRELVA